MEWLDLVIDLGNVSLSAFWFPLMLWTILAAIVTVVLRLADQLHAIYQYHGRVALLLSLPVGLAASYLTGLTGTSSTAGGLPSLKFIVVENPIPISDTAVSPAAAFSSYLTDPHFWIGIVAAVAILFAIVRTVYVIIDYFRLKKHANRFQFHSIYQIEGISGKNIELANRSRKHVKIAFTGKSGIPYTFGYNMCRVVIPEKLAKNPEILNMALRHELIHIMRRDFIFNNILLTVRALFWFHPLTHFLYREFKNWQEILCDRKVLEDPSISRKGYARLLFNLSTFSNEYRPATIAMASENPSILKKRIKAMKTHSSTIQSVRASIIVTAVTALLISGIMACSDIHRADENAEAEQQEVKVTGTTIDVKGTAKVPFAPGDKPLYVIDGEPSEKKTLSDIEPKNIESIEVLKGETAVSEYGEKAKNGVVIITTKNPEKVDMNTEINVEGNLDLQAEPNVKEEKTGKIENAIDLELIGNRQVTIGDKTVSIENLLEHIRKNYAPGNERLIRFIVNREVTYGELTDVQEILRKAGTLKIIYVQE